MMIRTFLTFSINIVNITIISDLFDSIFFEISNCHQLGSSFVDQSPLSFAWWSLADAQFVSSRLSFLIWYILNLPIASHVFFVRPASTMRWNIQRSSVSLRSLFSSFSSPAPTFLLVHLLLSSFFLSLLLLIEFKTEEEIFVHICSLCLLPLSLFFASSTFLLLLLVPTMSPPFLLPSLSLSISLLIYIVWIWRFLWRGLRGGGKGSKFHGPRLLLFPSFFLPLFLCVCFFSRTLLFSYLVWSGFCVSISLLSRDPSLLEESCVALFFSLCPGLPLLMYICCYRVEEGFFLVG